MEIEILDPAKWSALRLHAARGAVVIVSPELDIREAAKAVASDDAPQVQSWIEKGLLTKPTAAQLQFWEKPPEPEFVAAVLQPYVLIQIKSH